jgi:hypothetical protein
VNIYCVTAARGESQSLDEPRSESQPQARSHAQVRGPMHGSMRASWLRAPMRSAEVAVLRQPLHIAVIANLPDELVKLVQTTSGLYGGRELRVVENRDVKAFHCVKKKNMLKNHVQI